MVDTITFYLGLVAALFGGVILGFAAAQIFHQIQRRKLVVDENSRSDLAHQMTSISEKFSQFDGMVRTYEKDRDVQFGEISTRIRESSQRTVELMDVTKKLKETLSHSQSRGHLGEKLAADVLTSCGFLEGIHYLKQSVDVDNLSRPDFTFLLPNDTKLNMDVKFPFAKYLKLMESPPDQRLSLLKEFATDVKRRTKELTQKEYMSAKNQTLDCVLMLIPSDGVFAFIQAECPEVLDLALREKVIVCSPLTLFAVLNVIRQSLELFKFEAASKDMIKILLEFKNQWGKFVEKLEGVGQKIAAVQKEYDFLTGTRRNQLERTLIKLEQFEISAQAEEISRN